jgi:hypothetical protein
METWLTPGHVEDHPFRPTTRTRRPPGQVTPIYPTALPRLEARRRVSPVEPSHAPTDPPLGSIQQSDDPIGYEVQTDPHRHGREDDRTKTDQEILHCRQAGLSRCGVTGGRFRPPTHWHHSRGRSRPTPRPDRSRFQPTRRHGRCLSNGRPLGDGDADEWNQRRARLRVTPIWLSRVPCHMKYA